jgi:hypothetical protein
MNIAVARFDDTGNIDFNFGDSGRVVLPGEGKFGAAYALSVQEDGRIVAAGVSSHGSGYQIALARYQSSGALDTTFGLGSRAMQMARGGQPSKEPATMAGMGLGNLWISGP